MKSHAEVGALHLAGIEGSYPLAILVAYEHHMRYDGKPNYPLTRVPRKPTLASQMTAISDVFDAICTMRPYHKARARHVALGILRDRVGTFHHPALVANFVRLIGAEEPGPSAGAGGGALAPARPGSPPMATPGRGPEARVEPPRYPSVPALAPSLPLRTSSRAKEVSDADPDTRDGGRGGVRGGVGGPRRRTDGAAADRAHDGAQGGSGVRASISASSIGAGRRWPRTASLSCRRATSSASSRRPVGRAWCVCAGVRRAGEPGVAATSRLDGPAGAVQPPSMTD